MNLLTDLLEELRRLRGFVVDVPTFKLSRCKTFQNDKFEMFK